MIIDGDVWPLQGKPPKATTKRLGHSPRIEALIMANNSIQEALDRLDPELKARAEAARDNCTCAPCEAARYFHEELERLAGRSKMIKRTRQYDLGLTSACRLSLI